MLPDRIRPSVARAALVAAVVALALTASLDAKKIRVTVKHDPAFDFAGLKTWTWHPEGAGDVKAALSAETKPEEIRQKVEPTILAAIEQELASRGLVKTTGGNAQLFVNYYLLLTAGSASQQMGEFVAAVPEWGLPPLSGATQSLRVYAQGALVVDITSPVSRTVVWRGMAETEIDKIREAAERDQRLRSSIREMLAQFPPKPKSK
jgi:hypothetical protein